MRYKRLLRGAAIATPVTLAAMSAVALPAAAAPQTTARASAPAAVQPPLTAAKAAALSTNVTDKVIVVFKNQFAGLADTPSNATVRAADVSSTQSAVMKQLSQTHAASVKSFSLVNAVSATVSPGEAAYLAGNPAVSEVVPDLPIPLQGSDSPVTIAHSTAKASGLTPLPGACTSGKTVQLDPEAIENIHAATQSGKGDAAQALGYTGAGVKVAFIADGVNPDNPDFIRANGQHVFVDYQDFSGAGTNAPTDGGEAFLDSSSIAAQGREVYNVAGYGVGLSTPCKIRILGVAPGASLVGLNVFGQAEDAYNSVFLEAVNYAVNHDHVNVINESFGDNPFPDSSSLDLIKQANDAAVKAGVTVTVSSGDAGVTNTIGSPATDPNIISAGASTTYRAYAQSGIGDITAPGVKGWIDNNISGLSSGGIAENNSTVDVVAPGDLNWALCTANPALYADCTDFNGNGAPVELTGGTSEAAPLTAGTAALVIQAYRKAHNGATPSPAVVKQIIVSTAQNINAPADQQGAGLIDAYAAVLAAKSYHVKPAGTGHAILASATQLNAAGQPGTPEKFNETLTNDGAGSVTVGLSARTLSPYKAISTKSLSLTNAGDYSAEVTFTVPAGQARLNASVSLVGVVNLSLIAPDGDLAEYNLPQGVGNYGDAQVAEPAPGKWTALISSEGSGPAIPGQFLASTATWHSFGTVSPSSVHLAAGASGSFTLTVATPSVPGDQAGSIMVHNSANVPGFAAETTIPVTLRSLVPSLSTTFTGTLTGGNGRELSTGQSDYYEMAVPSGTGALNVSVNTYNANNTLFAELIDPSGDAVSAAANGLLATTTGGNSEIVPEVGAQLHATDPTAGTWTLVIDFYNTVSGTAAAQPFTVTVNDTPVTASAKGLPDGGSLTSGTPVTARVRVTNNGTVPEEYFVDPRLNGSVTVNLAAQSASVVTLPDVDGTVPQYLVPSHTTAIKATVSSSAPLFFDMTYPYGDPDVISTTGKTATASYSTSEVGPGEWTVTPFLVGPTGKNPAPNVNANVAMTATTAGFNPSITSPTGDLWLGSTNAAATFTPYVVNPGQSVSIPVTITPSGTVGATVTGTLYLADSSFISSDLNLDDQFGNTPEGSDVAAFPYSYTIG